MDYSTFRRSGGVEDLRQQDLIAQLLARQVPMDQQRGDLPLGPPVGQSMPEQSIPLQDLQAPVPANIEPQPETNRLSRKLGSRDIATAAALIKALLGKGGGADEVPQGAP